MSATTATMPATITTLPVTTPNDLLRTAMAELSHQALVRAFRDDGHGLSEHFDIGYASALRALGWTDDELRRLMADDES